MAYKQTFLFTCADLQAMHSAIKAVMHISRQINAKDPERSHGMEPWH
jgi:hypothetical protein